MSVAREEELFDSLEKFLHSRSVKVQGTHADVSISDIKYLADYDTLSIISKIMPGLPESKQQTCIEKMDQILGTSDGDTILRDEFAIVYEIPFSCMLIDCWKDSTQTAKILEILYRRCYSIVVGENESLSDENAKPIVLNAYYFSKYAYLFHNRTVVSDLFQETLGIYRFRDLGEKFDEQIGTSWHGSVDLSKLVTKINEVKFHPHYETPELSLFIDVRERIKGIHDAHPQKAKIVASIVESREENESVNDDFLEDSREECSSASTHELIEEEEDNAVAEGSLKIEATFEDIRKHTNILLGLDKNIAGFHCYFCTKDESSDRYILVFPESNKLDNIIQDQDRWNTFQKDLYYEDIRSESEETGIVYIIYILDGTAKNIPIQYIEGNLTYGRKYVFYPNEAVTYLNGIVNRTEKQIVRANPVEEWAGILKSVHLTGCLTESYYNKYIDQYLKGNNFDSDSIWQLDEENESTESVCPIKWVRSINTGDFRRFCFDGASLEFGQVNLLYGANGSGKSSVLEGIEYGLTGKIRRVKDFKIKFAKATTPVIKVYDRNAGVEEFTPQRSAKESKQIEKSWYGVPAGKTKTTLNENFSRFNSFNSEAAYDFIHNTDSSSMSFATMFGNLIFGENIVDYEKKWRRFQTAFLDRQKELYEEQSGLESLKKFYLESLGQKQYQVYSEDIVHLIRDTYLQSYERLPKDNPLKQDEAIFSQIDVVQHYVDDVKAALVGNEYITWGTLKSVPQEKEGELQKLDQVEAESRRQIQENLSKKQKLSDQCKQLKPHVEALEKKKLTVIESLGKWNHVKKVVNNKEAVDRVRTLERRIEDLNQDLHCIERIRSKGNLYLFLMGGDYTLLTGTQLKKLMNDKFEKTSKLVELQIERDKQKEFLSYQQEHLMQFKNMGKSLINGQRCPLCGSRFPSHEDLLRAVDHVVKVANNLPELENKVNEQQIEVNIVQSRLDNNQFKMQCLETLKALEKSVPFILDHKDDIQSIAKYADSKEAKEKELESVKDELDWLSEQGFSTSSIKESEQFVQGDIIYQNYSEYREKGISSAKDYDEFANDMLKLLSNSLGKYHDEEESYKVQIDQLLQENERINTAIEINEQKKIDLHIEEYRKLSMAINSITKVFAIPTTTEALKWIEKYYEFRDKVSSEIHRLRDQDEITQEQEALQDTERKIRWIMPQVRRCDEAVDAFGKMRTLSSYVESHIKGNIEQIRRYFMMMHHSGEFTDLSVDESGVYAVRGINKEIVRTYEMSTGQRTALALSVMLALYEAAEDAPRFLLLDEPLATMDDIQVLNVLDIFKALANHGTQIFFTTANEEMIKRFKECFKDTPYDYKEYHFVKKVNEPSDIKESSINDVRKIEDLTLDDLTLDFHQFASIRETLRKNQEKLLSPEELQEVEEEEETTEPQKELKHDSIEDTGKEDTFGDQTLVSVEKENIDSGSDVIRSGEKFTKLLTPEEIELLKVLYENPKGMDELALMVDIPQYISLCESINDKAVDALGDILIEEDGSRIAIQKEGIELLTNEGFPSTENNNKIAPESVRKNNVAIQQGDFQIQKPQDSASTFLRENHPKVRNKIKWKLRRHKR